MSDVTLSKAVRANLLNLQSTAAKLGVTQERLATGLRVNSALDNPTNFFTASSLNSRAADMNALLDAMSNGIQTIEAADNGLTAITKNLESMVSTLTQARQDKTFKAASYAISPTATGFLTLSGGALPSNTNFNFSLTGGTASPTPGTSVTNGFASFSLETAAAATSGSYTAATYAGSAFVGGTDSMTIDGQTITFDGTYDGTNNIAAGATGAYTIAEAIQKINYDLGLTASNVTATEGTGADAGKIVLSTTDTGTASNFAIVQSGTNTGGFTTGNATGGTDVGTPDSVTFNIDVDGAGATAVTLTAAQIGAIGNSDQVIDDITEYQALLQAGLTAAGVTGVTLSNDGANVTFTSDSTGVNSSVAITGGAVNNNNTTTALALASTGLDTLTEAAGAATGGASLNTIDQLVNNINNDTNVNTAVRASIDNGKLRIENLSTSALTITGYNSTSASIDGGTGTTTIGGNTVRADLATQYNTLIDQLDKFSDDASFNGVNLLRGDVLKITFNETSTSEIDIQTKDGKAVNSANLGVKTAMLPSDLDSDSAIEAFIVEVKTALRTVRSQASAFGSNLSVVQNRQDFTKHMITTLQTGASNLTLADSNEEAANLLALQTRQQLSSTALSLASEADQNVLRLF